MKSARECQKFHQKQKKALNLVLLAVRRLAQIFHDLVLMRKPRELIAGYAYHVVARANRQELIFENDSFKELFLEVIRQAKDKFSFKFRNFCIMGNHVHLDIEPDLGESLSKIMQWILGVFAIRYNKLHGYKGHVWYDRFKSRIIKTISQLINIFFYIANNPVRAGIVDYPLEYRFNGISIHKQGLGFYRQILDPLDEWLEKIIEEFLQKYDKYKAIKCNSKYSFKDKPAGRPRKNRQ